MFTRRTKIIAILSMLLLLSSVSTFFGLLYLVEKKESEFHSRTQDRARLTATKQQLTALASLVEDTKEKREELTTYVLREGTESSVIGLLSLIDTVAAEQQVVLETQSLNEIPATDSEIFGTLSLTVRIEGQYDRVAHVLRILESLPYQTTVQNVSLEESDPNVWIGTFSIHITQHKG